MGWKIARRDGEIVYHFDDPSWRVDSHPVFYVRATKGPNHYTSPKLGEMEVVIVPGEAITRWIESSAPRGSRVGTHMYEIAAKHACEKYGVPLMSGGLSKMSRGFWEKQLAKGRAKWLSVGRYSMGCPAPADLSGLRRR